MKNHENMDFDLSYSRFGVLVLKYSSFNAVFLEHGFFQARKTALKEECLYFSFYPLFWNSKFLECSGTLNIPQNDDE